MNLQTSTIKNSRLWTVDTELNFCADGVLGAEQGRRWFGQTAEASLEAAPNPHPNQTAVPLRQRAVPAL